MVIATPCIACIKVIVVFILEQTGLIKYIRKGKEKNEIEIVSLDKVMKK